MDLAEVRLWGRRIGAVSQADDAGHATFQYDPEFVASGIEIAPLAMLASPWPTSRPWRRSHR